MPRRILWVAAAILALAIGGTVVPNVFGSATQPDKVLLTYGGKPVTCRDLTLLTWPQIQRRLRAVARYVKRPPGGDWPRMEAMLFPVRGPILFYQPPRGASAAQVLQGMCRSYIQSAVDSYLAKRVVVDFAKHHPFHYGEYFHVSRLHAYNLRTARAWDAYYQLVGQFAENTWTPTQVAAATKKALPHLSPSLAADWVKEGTEPVRRQPEGSLIAAQFPCERHGIVAPWCKITIPEICYGHLMRAAIRPGRAKYAAAVGRLLGNSGFVVVEHLLPRDEAEAVRIIHACTGPHGRIDKPRLALIQICLWMLGSPTRIDPGFGGNYSYFSDLTGLPVHEIAPETFMPMKNKRSSFLYIYQRHPTVAKSVVAAYVWDLGEIHVLTPSVKRVLARTRVAVKWLVLPTMPKSEPFAFHMSKLVRWSAASPPAVFRTTSIFGFPRPQLVRKKYRLEKW